MIQELVKSQAVKWMVLPILLLLLVSLKPVDKHHFLIYGNVIELATDEMVESEVPNVQIIVYQDNEIYVAFNTNESGDYEFNLPNGHYYEIQYGTDSFVPKKIEIDAFNVFEKRDGHTLKMNVAVFKPIDNVDYALMDEPMSRFRYLKEKKGFELDLEYADMKHNELKDLYKEMKKMKKKNGKEQK